MDLVDGFRVFVAAVETGSLAAAAERLGLSPKLASKYMAELEARLGTRLLTRTTRQLGLTASGEQLLARAPGWLQTLDEMTGELREPRSGLAGTLRLSAPVSFGEDRLAPLLRQFRAPHPDLVIDLRLSDRFVDLAAEGIDVALRIGRLDTSSLVVRKLGTVRLLLVAAPEYITRRGQPETLMDLPRHACLRDTNLRGDGAWPLLAGGEVQRISVTGPFLVNSARLARELALAGEGIALSPDYVVAEDIAAGRLQRVLPWVESPPLDIHAVHLGQRQVARRSRALIDFLRRALSPALKP